MCRYAGLFHAVDVMPTLLAAAALPAPAGLDGVAQWAELGRGDTPGPRSRLVLSIDDETVPGRLRLPARNTTFQIAVRIGDYKG